MKRFSSICAALALFAASLPGGTHAQTHQTALIDSVSEAYRISNFIVAYSTPRERHILSHYPDARTLPVPYQTARLVQVHECMQVLANSSSPVRVIRFSDEAVISAPVPELSRIDAIGQDSNGVGVELTIHQLDVRTNLRLIEAYEDALIEGRKIPRPSQLASLSDRNPWRREMHRWRQEDGAWRLVNDDVAMLKAR